jgi:homocysteine S-methyltransferase
MSRYSIPILLLDGGLGTSLEDLYSVKFSENTPLWSGHLLVSSPGTLQNLQSTFAIAGADVILTATYQVSFFGFSKTPRFSGGGDVGYSRDETEGYMRSAITIARKAINEGGRRDGLLALSLGALGAVLIPSQEFTGAYPAQYDHWKGLYNFHLERIHVFSSDKPTWEQIDIVAFETLPVVREVRAVREVMGELDREGIGMKKFWISCVFPREDLRLPDGTGVADLVREMVRP